MVLVFKNSELRTSGSFAAPNERNAACPPRPSPSEHLHHAGQTPSPTFALPLQRLDSETRPNTVSG